MASDSKAQTILQAALEVFRLKSYHGATTKEIADAAGVSVGCLFRTFPNKEDLLKGLLAQLVEQVAPKLFAESMDSVLENYLGPGMEDAVRSFVHGRLIQFHEHRHLISVIHAESAFNGELRAAMFTQIYQPMRALIEKFVLLGIAKGQFREVDAAAAGRAIGSSILYTFLDVWYQGQELTGPVLEAMEYQFVDLILNGIKRKTP